MASAQIATYQNEKSIAATAKLFPGHGDTDVDSHTGFPVLDHSREEIENVDLPPFEAAVKANVASIMTAHMVVPALDPSGDPATLSQPIISGVLREQLGYDGVVITDSLGMTGVRQKYSDEQIPVLALKAGVDQLLMPPNLAVARNAVLNAVRTGELTEERIDTSVKRILDMKKRYGLFDSAPVDERSASTRVGTDANVRRATEITNRTVTLLKNDGNSLPLQASDQKILVVGAGENITRNLSNALESHGAVTTAQTMDENPDAATREVALARAHENNVIVVASDSARNPDNAGQRELMSALAATGKPVIAIAILTPYDIAYAPEVPSFLATYGYSHSSLEAAARVIVGEVSPVGALPVSIPSATDPFSVLYPRGYGLTY